VNLNAAAFARRHFQMIAGERCGDHLVAHVAHVNSMKRQFLQLAADGANQGVDSSIANDERRSHTLAYKQLRSIGRGM
jgi:hypothetical protein